MLPTCTCVCIPSITSVRMTQLHVHVHVHLGTISPVHTLPGLSCMTLWIVYKHMYTVQSVQQYTNMHVHVIVATP